MGHFRTYHNKKDDDKHEQERVYDGNGTGASLQQSLQAGYRRTHEVSEEDCEKEGDKSCASDVEKSEPQRKQEQRDQNPSRA